MENQQKDNIILFPKWKAILEEESLQALKQKRYLEALDKLDELISYDVNSHEIMIGKLICLMELDRYEDAQDLCEELIKLKDENYFHYLHIYLTILFQTSQYQLLMEQVEYEFEADTVPMDIKEQFQQLYDMSNNMSLELKAEQYSEYINELLEAVHENNHSKQWRTVENMRKLKVEPTKAIKELLKQESVHPVIKTTIFQWLQEKNVSEDVIIEKLNMCLTVNPTDTPRIASHGTLKQTLLLINEMEQKNPSLFQMIEKLLYRYIYVRYPMMPPNDETVEIAEALKSVGKEYLNIHKQEESPKQDILRYVEEIKMCETLYLSVIDE
ncbi:DUF3196 family protein [Virgibacillus byunsanensis]|uniref:DUF3196 family protein n=1 Tax=Virgibacillus byunsanensis TaxID=570945 RepID=A0ABW3LRQ9_9BACI